MIETDHKLMGEANNLAIGVSLQIDTYMEYISL